MKNYSFILFLLLFTSVTFLNAQQKQYTVKAGESVLRAIPSKEHYLLPAFENGGVFYKDGHHSPRLKMNFSELTGLLTFIEPKGDTMAYQNSPDIKYALIGTQVFIYDKHYGIVYLIHKDDSIKLGTQLIWDIVRKEAPRGDGYGSVSQTTALTATVNQRGTNNLFIVNENTVYGLKERYFLVARNQKIYFANKTGFLNAFPEIKELIKSYVRENPDFEQSRDYIEKLYNYCVKVSYDKDRSDTKAQ